ncbi:MAG: TIM barrel protein [Flavobacteriaceae bacterium]|nr:TIM barrel protein [Flavobacteriaceae bacterium]
MSHSESRRKTIRNIVLGAGLVGVSPLVKLSANDLGAIKPNFELKGNINHSVCRWCYQNISMDVLSHEAKEMGLKAIDLLKPSEWKTAQDAGLTCAVATDDFASITDGFNDLKNHDHLQKSYEKLIVRAAENEIPNVIVFSGNKRGMDDERARENCAKGLYPLVKLAEKHNITLIMELLNSKVDHHDYQCDRTPWGVALVDKIGSSNFKLLYDIYHMQIMEGDVIATIRKYHPYIVHYHTGGVPGRNEINDTQELNYPAIMRAILETGFKGYVAQEFIPTYEDKIAALKEGVLICDV